jgi:tetraacyldisaccharide 4'-kinase
MARRRARPQFREKIPVIIVGNITVGGTGKTPVVAGIAERLAVDGWKPAVVSRGYGGRRRTDPAQVSRDGVILMGPAEAGDEPVMTALHLAPGVNVFVGRDRVAAAGLAAGSGAGALVLDDGFQQRERFPGAFRILVVNAADVVGNGALLPAGNLREPVATADLADAIILTHADEVPAGRLGLVRAFLRQPGSARPLASAVWRFNGLDPVAGSLPHASLKGRKILALSAIGYPAGFELMLERETGRPVVAMHRPDHHAWTADEISAAIQAAAALGCEMVVTTRKDFMKMGGRFPETPAVPVAVARAGLVMVDGEAELEKALAGYLAPFRA